MNEKIHPTRPDRDRKNVVRSVLIVSALGFAGISLSLWNSTLEIGRDSSLEQQYDEETIIAETEIISELSILSALLAAGSGAGALAMRKDADQPISQDSMLE